MSVYEKIIGIATAVSACVAILSVILSVIAFLNTLKTSKLAYASLELSMLEHLSEIKHKIFDFLIKFDDPSLTIEGRNNLDLVYNGLKESYLNTLETLCSLYIDDKLDKKRFTNMYHEEIKKARESENYESLFKKPSSYECINLVYKKITSREV